LRRLPAKEREVVRMFYLEGRSYEEISTALHLPVNSIGPVLSRARKKLQAANGAAACKVAAKPATGSAIDRIWRERWIGFVVSESAEPSLDFAHVSSLPF